MYIYIYYLYACVCCSWSIFSNGEILIDGQNIKDINLKWLRSQIGLVQQEPMLFDQTIYENMIQPRNVHSEDIDLVCIWFLQTDLTHNIGADTCK